jgi:hypothetical protein
MSDFYPIEHEGTTLELPRVTSILRILDKSGPLMGWAVKMEREAIRGALEAVLTEPGELNPQQVWDHMQGHLKGQRASLKKQDDAANIGRAAHMLIEWHTRKMLGSVTTPEPTVSMESLRAVIAWLDWAEMVNFTPLMTEARVYCPICGYAGTIDTVGKVQGVMTLIDYKTSKAIYPEAFLQVNLYRHAAKMCGIEVEQAMVLRLPKTAADPLPEPVVAPVIPLRLLQAILTTWRTMRWMNEEPFGTTPPAGRMCASEPKATAP